jgi:hypothetical protein
MLVIRNPLLASDIADPDIRSLVEQRFIDRCAGEEYEDDLHGYLIVVQPGDSVQSLEQESSCPILHNLVGDAQFGDPGFAPCFEMLEEHRGCYEMVFVPSDGDFGIGLFIPKMAGIDADLLALCALYATPSPEL